VILDSIRSGAASPAWGVTAEIGRLQSPTGVFNAGAARRVRLTVLCLLNRRSGQWPMTNTVRCLYACHMGGVEVIDPGAHCAKKVALGVGAALAVGILALNVFMALGFAIWQIEDRSTSWPHFAIDIGLGVLGPAIVFVSWLLDADEPSADRLRNAELIGVITGLALFVPIVGVGIWGGIF
jgi:hypothetical protein